MCAVFLFDDHFPTQITGNNIKKKSEKFKINKTLTDSISFKKHIDFNLTEGANTLDIPGLRKLINNLILDSIAKALVLPNRLCVPILNDLSSNEFNSFRATCPQVFKKKNKASKTFFKYF